MNGFKLKRWQWIVKSGHEKSGSIFSLWSTGKTGFPTLYGLMCGSRTRGLLLFHKGFISMTQKHVKENTETKAKVATTKQLQ